MDHFAEMLLHDYNPTLLKKPSTLNYLHFIEYYLGVNVEFQDIYYEDDESPILGATVFQEGTIRVFDRHQYCTREIQVQQRTIVLDNHLMEKGNEGLALFTGLHEAGHVWLHSQVCPQHSKGVHQGADGHQSRILCCRAEHIEGFRQKEVTPEDWREHQANDFALALSMPNAVFIPFVLRKWKEEGIHQEVVIVGNDPSVDWKVQKVLPDLLSHTFGVSKQAAMTKLRKVGLVIERNKRIRMPSELTFV
jgi:Zn-dependent peptidase ImmA (M78 family)